MALDIPVQVHWELSEKSFFVNVSSCHPLRLVIRPNRSSQVWRQMSVMHPLLCICLLEPPLLDLVVCCLKALLPIESDETMLSHEDGLCDQMTTDDSSLIINIICCSWWNIIIDLSKLWNEHTKRAQWTQQSLLEYFQWAARAKRAQESQSQCKKLVPQRKWLL